MKPYFRAILYAGCLLGILSALTAYAYRTPSQVRSRVERALSEFARVPLRAEGCSQAFGRVRVERLEVPAAPASETVAAVRFSRLEANVPEAFVGEEVTGAGESRLSVVIDRAELELRRSGRDGAGTLEQVFRIGALLERARELRFLGLVEELSVSVRDGDLDPSSEPLVLQAREVRVRCEPSGAVRFEARLWPGRAWAWGSLRGEREPEGVFRLRGEIGGLREPARLLALVTEERGPWRILEPVLPVDLELEELSLGSGRKPKLSATMKHYDSTLRVGSAGLALAHVCGKAKLKDEALEIEESEEGVRGELWGAPARVSGEVGPGGGRLVVRVPPASVENMRESGEQAGASLVPRVLGALGISGTFSGLLRVNLRASAPEDWEGEFRFEVRSFRCLPLIEGLQGTIRVDRSLAPAASGSQGEIGRGRIAVERLLASGLAPVSGEVSFSWSDEELRFKAYLETERPEATRGPGEGPAIASGEQGAKAPGSLEGRSGSGSIFGTVGWSLRGGGLDAALRCMGLSVSTALLRARDLSGELEFPQGGASARISLSVAGAAIPAGALWQGQEELPFEAGKATFKIAAGRVAVESVRLLARDRCLRARGEADFARGVDLIVCLFEGPEYLRVHALDDSSGPPDWKAAAGEGFRTFRVTGSLLQPSVRAISSEDGVFFVPR